MNRDFSAGNGTDQPKPVRLLVVDDSAFMRFTISQHLSQHPAISVVGTARDGQEALEMIPRLDPNVVSLDVEMPRMDGLTTLRAIMSQFPRPVVMFSSLTQAGAAETIQALTYGAVDFVGKPAERANIQAVLTEAAEKIVRAAGARVFAPHPPTPAADRSPRPSSVIRLRHPGEPVVVIGTSTGGPRALHSVFSRLNAAIPAALVVVQHMPAGFTRSLAERLDSLTDIRVKEAEEGDRLKVGQALVAPGGSHLVFDAAGVVSLNKNPTVHGVRPSIDVTVNSIASHFGRNAVSVTLTGMGSDGTHGAVLVHHSGGKVIAEDESSCVVWGMPRCVAETGMADEIVPLEQIPAAIERAVKQITAKG